MSKQPRKESTSIRLEPQVRYLVELAARIQRRNLTNFIEWSLEESLKQVKLRPDGESIAELTLQLWDVNEFERLIKLASVAPELLTIEEQLIFKVLIDKELDFLHKSVLNVSLVGNLFHAHYQNGFSEPLSVDNFDTPRINLYWEKILSISNGDYNARKSILDDGLPF